MSRLEGDIRNPQDMTDEFLDRLLAGESAFSWMAAQMARNPESYLRGPSLIIALAVFERRLARLEEKAGLPTLTPKDIDRGIAELPKKEAQVQEGEDLTHIESDGNEDEEIHETVELAGSDVEVPTEIEERLAEEKEDASEELAE